MKFAITGSTGFIGTALTNHLKENGHEVVGIVRSNPSAGDILWDPAQSKIDSLALDDASPDVVVHLAGAGVADKRWTNDRKKLIFESRSQSTDLLAKTLIAMKKRPSMFISGSAVGFYGSRKDEILDETSSRGEGFLSDVCVAWEHASKSAKDAGINTATIRTGHVLDSSGAMLKKLLTPFKLGIGGKLGKGDQYLSWISLEDEARAITYLAEKNLDGVFNLSGPVPVTNSEFTIALGKRLSRPTLLPTPLLPLKAIYGNELVENILLGSQRAVPNALIDAGFDFKHKTIEEALAEVI